MNKKRKSIIENNEISSLYTFHLGGYDQKIMIERKSKELPIVVTLHGGPGTPIPFSVGCRGLFPYFTNRFIMVYWDQLGCGINNYVIDEKFKIDHFVGMTADLLQETNNMFLNNGILLFATSWGWILSAKVLEKADNIVNSVVVCGQIIKNVFLPQEVFNALEKSNLRKKKLKTIRNISIENISSKDLQLTSSSLRKYTNSYENKKGERAPIGTSYEDY